MVWFDPTSREAIKTASGALFLGLGFESANPSDCELCPTSDASSGSSNGPSDPTGDVSSSESESSSIESSSSSSVSCNITSDGFNVDPDLPCTFDCDGCIIDFCDGVFSATYQETILQDIFTRSRFCPRSDPPFSCDTSDITITNGFATLVGIGTSSAPFDPDSPGFVSPVDENGVIEDFTLDQDCPDNWDNGIGTDDGITIILYGKRRIQRDKVYTGPTNSCCGPSNNFCSPISTDQERTYFFIARFSCGGFSPGEWSYQAIEADDENGLPFIAPSTPCTDGTNNATGTVQTALSGSGAGCFQTEVASGNVCTHDCTGYLDIDNDEETIEQRNPNRCQDVFGTCYTSRLELTESRRELKVG